VLHDLGLEATRLARVIVAASILDDLLTLVLFSVVVGIVQHGTVEPLPLLWVATRAALFLGLTIVAGRWLDRRGDLLGPDLHGLPAQPDHARRPEGSCSTAGPAMNALGPGYLVRLWQRRCTRVHLHSSSRRGWWRARLERLKNQALQAQRP
jgi:hypothetical protein